MILPRYSFFSQQKAQLSQKGLMMLRVNENLGVTQGRSKLYEITLLSKP